MHSSTKYSVYIFIDLYNIILLFQCNWSWQIIRTENFCSSLHPLHRVSLYYLYNSFIFLSPGELSCKLLMFLPTFCVAVTIFTMCLIAYDRRIAINKITATDGRRGPGILMYTLSVWLLGLAISSPTFYEYSVYTATVRVGSESQSSSEEVDGESHDHGVNVTTYRACGSHGIVQYFEQVYATLVTLILYVLPLIFILYNYVMIFLFIWKKETELKRNRNEPTQTSSNRVISSNTSRVLKMLFAVITIFTFAWAPYFFLFFREVCIILYPMAH